MVMAAASMAAVWAVESMPAASPLVMRLNVRTLRQVMGKPMEEARKAAMDEGLNYVYLGNVPEHPGGHTYCPKCKKKLIQRIGYNVKVLGLADGHCQ